MAVEISHPTDQPRVLVVDDEKFIRDILADFLTMEGYSVRTADDGTQAVQELSRSNFALVISDLKMPKMGGLELLQHIAKMQPEALTVIMTGFGTVETAIDAMKHGAYDYILKPFKVEEIVHVVQRGLEKQRLAAENLRLREAVSLYKVSEAITASLSLDDVVATVQASAFEEMDADAIFVWLDDGEGEYFERLKELAEPKNGGDGKFDPGTLDPAIVAERLTQDQPLVLHGVAAAQLLGSKPDKPLVSTATVPLRMREKLIGWITVASYTLGKHFTEGQRKLLSIIASRAAAAIENARLYEDLQATFQQTIQSLANTIDKMDRYTAGHSERVALYSTRLARWLGLDEAQVEIVRQAALMHDIGKVGCVMNLNKPGKLSAVEYEMFQKHPTYGKEILDPIAFLEPVIPGVHLHHERWDGRGYPLGMEGDKIPLIARIISVADTYDAMTSDRAYRQALPHEVTVGEIERCSGSQFDPDAAGVFTENIDRFREERQAAGIVIPTEIGRALYSAPAGSSSSCMAQPLNSYFLGTRPYLPTLALMGEMFEARRAGQISDSLLLLEHEPVITLGRGAHEENLLESREQLAKIGVSVVETGRGGDVTLHAPGQLIAYPIVALSPDRQDVRKYVQALTEVMRRLVEPEGISGGTISEMIGLWVDSAAPGQWPGEESARAPAKIGAIGVRISRWVTQHGFALNLTTDLSLYRLIVPCGISRYPVASVHSLTGRCPSLRNTAEKAVLEFNELLGGGEASWLDCSEEELAEVMRVARDHVRSSDD